MYSFWVLLIPALIGVGSVQPEHDYYWDDNVIGENSGWSTDIGSTTGDSCSIGSFAAGNEVDQEALKERIDILFPELNGNVSIEQLGSSSLVRVDSNEHDLSFVMTGDGNYLFTDSYFDLSLVHSSDDADKMRAIELTSSRGSGASTSATSTTSTAGQEGNIDEQLLKEEAFKWVVDNTTIKYPATTDEPVGDIVVFADYTCPECAKFHSNYSVLQDRGYNLHIALLNRRGNSGPVFSNTQAIQCSANPRANYESAIATRSVSLPAPGPDCTPFARDFFEIATRFMSQEMDNPGTPGIWVNGERFVNRIEALSL